MPVSVIADTLERDTALIAAWRADASYSYYHDLVTPEMDIFDWMAWQIWKLIDKLSQLPASEGGFKFLWIGIGVLCLVLLFLFIYRMHPGIFVRSPKKNVMSVAAGETIYGVDFQHEIEKAVAASRYTEAVCLLYRYTLRQLSDAGRIDWQLYKTPAQYNYEVKTPEFRAFTSCFLRVRYGNFEADEAVYQRMESLRSAIVEGGNG